MADSLKITRRAAARLRAGHRWVYRSDLLPEVAALQAQAPRGAEAAPESGFASELAASGSLVTVADPAGHPLGTALYSSASQIALRLVSRVPGLSRAAYLEDVRQRIQAAVDRRRVVAPLGGQPGGETTAQRLVFSEADELPGIIVDRYGSLAVVQLLTQGTAQADVREVVSEALAAALRSDAGELTLWERPDARIRELEQLDAPPPETPLRYTGGGPAPQAASFLLNGLRFHYDLAAGQKTGAFLDQRLNYRAAAEWVRRSGRTGSALDICTYQGGFALHLAQVCRRVTGVDQSRAALEQAERNLQANAATLNGEVDWIEADAFALLRGLEGAGAGIAMGLPARFDAIVLDPPAFTKSRRALEGALRGYKELNLRALRLLEAGGTLVTCSCSHHVSLEVFWNAVSEAAADAGRRVQVLEARAAAPDHPEMLALPETRYLKCLICRVD